MARFDDMLSALGAVRPSRASWASARADVGRRRGAHAPALTGDSVTFVALEDGRSS
jgi:hypothetical protein